MKRIKRLTLDGPQVLAILKVVNGGFRATCLGFPQDVRLVEAATTQNAIILYIESATFEPVPEGEPIPEAHLCASENCLCPLHLVGRLPRP